MALLDTQVRFAPGPIGGSLAWRSADMADQTNWILRLDADDVREIEAAAEHSLSLGLEIMEITAEDFPLPRVSAKAARLLDDCLNRHGFGYLRGLPAERYDYDMLTRIYWGLSRHLGDPVPMNRNGHLIGHVIDIGDTPDNVNIRITQTAAALNFHSDACDLVGLMCLNTAREGGDAALVSGVAVHDEMLRRDPELCHLLYSPVVVDRRGEVPAGKHPWMEIPVFMWDGQRFNGYAPLHNYVLSARRFDDAPKMSDAQWAAINLFLEICNEPEFSLHIPFEKGDLQYVHNHVVFHSRTAYVDWPEPEKKRHLMRIWLSVPGGRDLHPSLAERWINITRGTVRGGVNIPDRKPLTIPPRPDVAANY